jgi:HEAT repeat protein
VRETATESLGHIADPAARAALQAALQSPDPKVRRAAAEALGQDR